MAIYKDKATAIATGYGDTNVNVFTLASLPFNDVFDYFGVSSFTDKKTEGETAFSTLEVDSSAEFEDTKVASSAEFSKLKVESSSNFIDEKTDEQS